MNDPIQRPAGNPAHLPLSDSQEPQDALNAVDGATRAGVAAQSVLSAGAVPMSHGAVRGFSASRPELPAVNASKVDWSALDGQSVLQLLGMEQSQRSLEVAEADTKLAMKQQKDAADQRLKEIETAIKKSEEAKAKENSFWARFCKVLSAVASVVGGVASFALGAMLTTTGVGAIAGTILMAHAVSTLANTVMETLISTGAIDDPGWRPTLACATAKLLEACHVDPKTAAILGMVVELAVVLAVNMSAFMSIRSSVKEIAESCSFMGSKFANEMASQAAAALTLGRAGRVAEIGGAIVKAGSDIGSQAINLDVADLKFESDQAHARAEAMKALTARLAKTMQMDMEMIQVLTKRIQANTEAVSDIVRDTAEVGRTVASNMGHSA